MYKGFSLKSLNVVLIPVASTTPQPQTLNDPEPMNDLSVVLHATLHFDADWSKDHQDCVSEEDENQSSAVQPFAGRKRYQPYFDDLGGCGSGSQPATSSLS